VRLWDADTGVLRTTLPGHTGPVSAVAFAADGSWLATAGTDGMVRLRDAGTGLLLATLSGDIGPVSAMAIAADGSWLATAGEDRTVRLWNAANGRCSAVMRVEQSLRCCAWSPLSDKIIVGGTAGLYRFDLRFPAT
jgi:WD40 repeat protein